MQTAKILAILALIALSIGCTSTEEKTKYVCPSGSIVDNVSYCPADEFKKTEYVCPNGTIVNDASKCSKQYVCMNNEVVDNIMDCESISGSDEVKESREYWETASPFQIEDYRVARKTIFMKVTNSGTDELEIQKAFFDDNPLRLGFINTTFKPGEEKYVSGDIEDDCEEGENYSYLLSIKYDNKDSGLNDQVQTGEIRLKGNCEPMPRIALDISCTGSTKSVNGTIIIKNDGLESVPANSLNFEKKGGTIIKLPHNKLPPGQIMELTSDILGEKLTEGIQGEVWMTGDSHSSFVCMG